MSPEDKIAYAKMSSADKIVYAKQHPGKYPFGNSLFLVTRDSGKGYWVQQYRSGASFSSKSLGTLAKLNSHTKATGQAKRFWNVRDKEKGTDEARKAAGPLFSAVVIEYLDGYDHDGHHVTGKSAGWRGNSEADTYRRNLIERGKLAAMHAAKITPQDIAAHLRLFEGKPRTAERVRSHIQNVMAFVIAREIRPKGSDNPASADGPLAHLPWPKVDANTDAVVSHTPVPRPLIPGLYRDVQAINTPTARALSLIMLTGLRASEVVGAQWNEVDLEQMIWTLPGSRMKGKGKGVAHSVPLTAQMLAVMGTPSTGAIFPGNDEGHVGPKNPLHTMRTVYSGEGDVHGFRNAMTDYVVDNVAIARQNCMVSPLYGTRYAGSPSLLLFIHSQNWRGLNPLSFALWL